MRSAMVRLAGLLVAAAAAHTCAGEGPRAPLERAAETMGALSLMTVRYEASGSYYALGQSARPGGAWPRFALDSLVVEADYTRAALAVDMTWSGIDPPRGGGQPLNGPVRRRSFVAGDTAWSTDGVVIEPEPHAAAERALDLWLTPHGFLKAALAHRARVRSAPDGGTRVTFTVLDTYEVTGLIGPTHLVERIETAIPHPVLGDMPSVTVFHGYRDVGGVQFPSRIEQTRGGHPVLDVTVGAVVPNPPLAILPPREVVGAVAPPVRVELDEVDEGVHYVTGGSHHSVVIEFGDHVAIVEAPLDDARSRAVIDAVRGLLPRKAIRYVINTHHHFDHAGGLRAYVAEGAIVVTHAINRAFYERAWSAPRTILPDRLAAAPRPPEFITVDDWHELTDRRRFIEVYHVAGNTHDEGLLMVWMPRERILIQADAFTPAPPGAEPGPNPFSVNLYENIERLGLPVDLILPLHGEMATAEDLRQAAGRGDTAVEAGSGVVNRQR